MELEKENSIGTFRHNIEQDPHGDTKAFLPQVLLRKITESSMGESGDKKEILRPNSLLVKGVVLIADISGFTRLSGRYCALGKEGIDKLQKTVNDCIGLLVEIVHIHGGDVIKFAGDAVICIFVDNQEEDLEVSAGTGFTTGVPYQALLCAKELSLLEIHDLTVHVGLSYGEICFATVGGYQGCYDYLIGGMVVRDISQCLDDAKSKQVVGTEAYMEQLLLDEPIGVTAIAKVSGNFLIDTPELSKSSRADRQAILEKSASIDMEDLDVPSMLETVSHFIPKPILQSLEKQTNKIEALAELREVTTMFMMWGGYNPDKHRDLMSLQPLFLKAQEILAKKGGFIRQFLVDDKGCVLIANWGVPTATYVDNALRALAAAIQLRKHFASQHFTTSYGITTGNVYCGTVGSDLRRDYSVIGDVVNMAARLMGKAKHGALIDQATFDRLPSRISCSLEALAPIVVKGKTEPIQVYATPAEEDAASDDEQEDSSTLVDYLIRTQHTHELMTILNEVAPVVQKTISSTFTRTMTKMFNVIETNHPLLQTVYIEGKAGCGSASLMTWLEREVKPRNVHLINILLTQGDVILDYRALVLLFHSIMGEQELDDCQGEEEVVTNLLEELHEKDETDEGFNLTLSVMQYALGVTVQVKRKPRVQKLNDKDQLAQLREMTGKKGKARVKAKAKAEKQHKKRLKKADKNTRWKGTKKVAVLTEEIVLNSLVAVFGHLLGKSKFIIMVGRVHFADEKSLRAMKSFLSFHSPSMLVFSCVPITDVLSSNISVVNSLHSPGHSGSPGHNSPKNSHDSSSPQNSPPKKNPKIVEANRLSCITQLRDEVLLEGTIVEVLPYTIDDIEAILCSALNCSSPPIGLAELVHQLSNGAAFWVKEVVEFVLHTGADEFLELMDVQTSTMPMNRTKSSVRIERKSSSQGDLRVGPNNTSLARIDTTSNKSTNGATANGVLMRSHNANRVTSPDEPSLRQAPTTAAVKKSKLDTFVICRLEGMSADTRKIVKVASVLGVEFSIEVLRGVLSEGLQGQLDAVVTKLIKFNWLVQDSEDPSFLLFAHDFIYTTVLGLVPQSQKIEISAKIIQFVESTHPDDQSYFFMLSEHCRVCKNLDKAFEYCCRAIVSMLDPAWMDELKCKEMLSSAVTFCTNMTDVDLVLNLLDKVVSYIRSHNNDKLERRDMIVEGFDLEEIAHVTSSDAGGSTTSRSGSVCCGAASSSGAVAAEANSLSAVAGSVKSSNSFDKESFSSKKKSALNHGALTGIQKELAEIRAILEQKRAIIDDFYESRKVLTHPWQRDLLALIDFEKGDSGKSSRVVPLIVRMFSTKSLRESMSKKGSNGSSSYGSQKSSRSSLSSFFASMKVDSSVNHEILSDIGEELSASDSALIRSPSTSAYIQEGSTGNGEEQGNADPTTTAIAATVTATVREKSTNS